MLNCVVVILQALWLIIRNPLFTIECVIAPLWFNIFGIPDMEEEPISGKIAIVTGSNCGIGKQVAKEFAERGATVILACRNLVAGRQAIDEIKSLNAQAKLELYELDLANLSSVRKFASEVKSCYPQIHLLVNNAGVCSFSEELQKTVDGFELHMGVNHLGHFLLTNLLMENLKAGVPSKVVTVSSTAMLLSDLRLNDMMMEKSENPTLSTGLSRLPYNNSKMANALFSLELARRLEGTGVNTYCVCPGPARTEVWRDAKGFENLLVRISIGFAGFPVTKGSLGVRYCALSSKCKDESGKFYRFGKVYKQANRKLNVQDAQELWELSQELVLL